MFETKNFFSEEIGKEIYLHHIIATKDFGNIRKGDVGGWIENETCLSQYGNCWVSDNACVFDGARIEDNAFVSGNARIYGNARCIENCKISGNARIYDGSWVMSFSCVSDNACVSRAYLHDLSIVKDNSAIFGFNGKIFLYKNITVKDNAEISGNLYIEGNIVICDDVKIESLEQRLTIRENINHLSIINGSLTIRA